MADGNKRRPHRGRPGGRPAGRRSEVPTQARLLAVRVLERVQRTRAYADLALHGELGKSSLSAKDRGLATELAYGTLRWRGRIDYLLSHVLDREVEKLEPIVACVLRVGAYQILFSDRIPDSAAVDQSVRCVRAAGSSRAAGLVNAVLRRFIESHQKIPLPELDSDPVGHLTHVLSLPGWIAERWVDQFGAQAAAELATASNQVPPRTIRVNTQRIGFDELLTAIRERDPEAKPCGFANRGIVLGGRGDPGSDPHFVQGHYTVQDEASQLIAQLLDVQPGQRILDTCAAPGAKATALAERVGTAGRVIALDRHPRRLGLVRRDARRLGLVGQIETQVRDASRPLSDLAGETGFDAVLVDAPCSGLGTLRRNPDARWRVRPRDPARLAQLQRDILHNASAVLRPGGKLVYSTCTLLREENEEVVETFLREAPDFRLVERGQLPESVQPVVGDDHLLRTFPHIQGTDGFFAARFERQS